MDEASDVLSNKRDRLSKRRKLNIDNATGEDVGLALNTPKSQRVGDWVAGTQTPILIDLTGDGDTAPSETSGSEITSEDCMLLDPSHTNTASALVRELSHVQIPRPSLPSAVFSGWHAPTNSLSEADALVELSFDLSEGIDGSRYIQLDNFTIHRPLRARLGMEMCTLDRLQVESGVGELRFSAKLSTARAEYYVHDAAFSTLTVDGYGDINCGSLLGKICIQSPKAHSHNVWYRLGRPSVEYRAFHEDYVWLATFTKFFIDFLIHAETDVTLHSFRSKFAPWILRQYAQLAPFQTWHQKCGFQQDFGTSAAAYVYYLYKESFSIDDTTSQLLQHSIWREIHPGNLSVIKRQPTDPSKATVVTPFAFRCFKDMYFAAHLEIGDLTPALQAQITNRKRELCLTPWNAAPVLRPRSNRGEDVGHLDAWHDAEITLDIQQGDVVRTSPNPDDHWKHSKAVTWYAYVQSVHRDSKGSTKLDVLWLYEPSDTTLGNAYYPFKNELFLSDNCSCGSSAVPIEAVVAKVNVSWFINDPHAVKGYFIRQKFQTIEAEDSYGFVTLTSNDFSCHDSHLSEFELCRGYYKVGHSVLARPQSNNDPDISLQPMRIVRFDMNERRVILRQFHRASWHDSTAPPNELLETNEEATLTAQRISRTCEIGHFRSRKDLVLPFSRDGLGDYFYVLKDDPVTSTQTSLQTPPESDVDDKAVKATSSVASTPLAGLDLFCGGGNFGRGLEEAGVVKMRYAVDWDAPALHSYRANVDNPSEVHYFLGSVNDYLRQALRGSSKAEVARIGSIDFVSAGSPCPGFSTMQQNKGSHSSLQFASMVASVVAFVDTYSPQYFILENVVPMTHRIVVDGQEQNVFSQILASLVALGYQVQQFLGDAWTFGSSQQRSRVFIVASAPGTVPLHPPACTHSHPPGPEIKRSLGKTTNGLPFGIRRFESTTNPFVSARTATQDLPDIGDSLTQICPKFPDHRTTTDQSLVTRQRLARVPTHPVGDGLVQAVQRGVITSGEAYDWVIKLKGIKGNKTSRSYSRIRPDRLFPTILTALHLQCGINGSVLHWEQHRSLSVLETRRAQGFFDHEVLVGAASQQLKIVGNSVDRKVAFGMGLTIKESWESTVKVRREMLRGLAPVANIAREIDGISDDKVSSHTQDQSAARPHPSPAQIESAKREWHQMRAKAFSAILQRHRRPQQERQSTPFRPIAAQPEGQRWSGRSPADAIAIRRLQAELDTVLPLRRGHSP